MKYKDCRFMIYGRAINNSCVKKRLSDMSDNFFLLYNREKNIYGDDKIEESYQGCFGGSENGGGVVSLKNET